MSVEVTWRGTFTNREVNTLHAAAFRTRVYDDDEWDWCQLVERHSLGWVVARDELGLVGFANVVWDGLVHAWIQDVMVDDRVGRQGIGSAIVTSRAGGPEPPAARSSTSTSMTICPRSTSTHVGSRRPRPDCCGSPPTLTGESTRRSVVVTTTPLDARCPAR